MHSTNLWLIYTAIEYLKKKSALFDSKQFICNLPILRPILKQRCFVDFLVKTRSILLNYPKCSWLCRFYFWFNFPPKLTTIQQCVETNVRKKWMILFSVWSVQLVCYIHIIYICVCVMVSEFGFKTEHIKKKVISFCRVWQLGALRYKRYLLSK